MLRCSETTQLTAAVSAGTPKAPRAVYYQTLHLVKAMQQHAQEGRWWNTIYGKVAVG